MKLLHRKFLCRIIRVADGGPSDNPSMAQCRSTINYRLSAKDTATQSRRSQTVIFNNHSFVSVEMNRITFICEAPGVMLTTGGMQLEIITIKTPAKGRLDRVCSLITSEQSEQADLRPQCTDTHDVEEVHAHAHGGVCC